ncbi:unnamed protein product [Mytilus edulis]|uniref:Cadherin domain-containing protein n=1 Tax=Mytilus edulis TaxID=6550 RepID=A0A8S3Q727_MYTED|nr:unnamed protein product [Mytilus edulis]
MVTYAMINIDISKTKIPENTEAGYCVYMGTVDDVYDSHVYTIISDVSNRFQILQHRLCLKVKANFEDQPNKWNITIRTTDLDKAFFEKIFEFEILNANDPPKAAYLTPDTIPENSMINTTVGCFSGADDDPNQTLSFLLVNSNYKMFASYIENGQTCLKVAKDSNEKCPSEGGAYCLLNREKRKKRTVTVMARDDGNPRMKAYFDIHIHLSDVNDKPTEVVLDPSNIPEGVQPGNEVVAVVTKDEDIDQSHTYELINDPSGVFTIKDGKLIASRSFDYETEKLTEFTIDVKSTDNGENPLSVTSTIKFKIQDMNEVPYALQVTAENSPLSYENDEPKVRENANHVVIGTINVKDYDEGDWITLTLLDNADGRLELKNTICSSVGDVNVYCKGLLTTHSPFNYEIESSVTFSVQATDKAGLTKVINLTLEVVDFNDAASIKGIPPMSHDKEIVINIIDINEAPLDIQISKSQVAENSVNDVVVGNLTTIDPDNSGQTIQTFNYQLIDDGQGRFEIKGNTLQVKKSSEMCDNKPCILDYEQDKVVNIKVKVTDDGTPPLTLEKVMAISVTDVNDPPVIDIVGDTVPENSDADFEIGRYIYAMSVVYSF